jgi:serine/threonine-protein kinase HipA
MPVRKEAYQSPFLFPYFYNMLSEGANRQLQSTLLHIDENDDFGILLATAQHDTIGAVTIKPIG